MNIAKIAALYASPIFNTLLRFPNFDTTTTLTKQVMEHVLREARVVSEDGRRYQADASYPHRRERYTDDLGYRTTGFMAEYVTKRAAEWMLSQMPGWPEEGVDHLRKGMPEQDVLLVSVMGYGRHDEAPEHDIETRTGMRFGAQEDLEIILRGIASIRRKRRKQAKKLEAQLRAYHARQELATLRNGQWLGAEKAITTAARINEPSVPFLGDAGLTHKQRQELDLRYWAVAERTHGMSAAFPVGTGIALKPVKRSRELVDGAVYLWLWVLNGKVEMSVLGHLDMSAKQRGYLPLRIADTGKVAEYCWAAYGDSAVEKGIEIYQVTHYTTRNAEPVVETAATPLHQPQLRGQRRTRRELEAA